MPEPAPLTSELAPAHEERGTRLPRPALGYAMLVLSATLFSINGTVSKVALASGLSSSRLTEIRSLGALVGLAALVAVASPAALRLRLRELPLLVVFGVLGLALVQWLYFIAIHRLAVGVALVIEYLSPVIVALFARFVLRERVRDRVFAAIVLALVGLTLVVELWSGFSLDAGGVAAGLGAACALAVYFLSAERLLGGRDPLSLACFGFLFASIFFAVLKPWWSFPFSTLGRDVSLLGRLHAEHLPVWSLGIWIVVPGTIVPFLLSISALRHLPATRAAIVAMLEPVLASVVAYAWLGESLGVEQLVGGAVVLAGVALAQTAR